MSNLESDTIQGKPIVHRTGVPGKYVYRLVTCSFATGSTFTNKYYKYINANGVNHTLEGINRGAKSKLIQTKHFSGAELHSMKINQLKKLITDTTS